MITFFVFLFTCDLCANLILLFNKNAFQKDVYHPLQWPSLGEGGVCLPGGCLPWGGRCLPTRLLGGGGVSACWGVSACRAAGGVCPGGVCLPRGVPARGCLAARLPGGGCMPGEGVCLPGVCGKHPPWTE